MKTAKLSPLVVSALLAMLAVGCSSSSDAPDDPTTGGEDVEQADSDLTQTKRVLKKSDDNKLVSVKVGQSIAVELAANPTTGFDWSMESETGDSKLGAPKRTFVRGEPSDAVGFGGKTTLTWTTQEADRGEHTVKLTYKRGFGTRAPNEEDTFTLRVRIVAYCGGVAGLQCKAGETCAEDTLSTCFPTAGQFGGRDCMGICKK